MNRNFECTQVNETEVDIRVGGYLEWRLCLVNRAHDCRRFELARPGLGGNFETSYRWETSFPVVSRTIRSDIEEALRGRCAGAMGIGEHVDAVMEARRMLMRANRAFLPRTRA